MANIDIGKNIASVRTTEGRIVNFFNHTLLASDINKKIYYDIDGNARYEFVLDSNAINNKYRCAYFAESYSQGAMDGQPHILLMFDQDVTSMDGQDVPNAIPVFPIYEFITPTVMNVRNDTMQLSWWSNVSSNMDTSKGYDANFIHRFSSDNLYLDTTVITYKILCTAIIRWQFLGLQAENGVRQYKLYPIINKPVITTVIKNEGYVIDFEAGSGNGGGIGMHSHTSNQDGGFAAAVFMPSANIKPLNWA